MRGLKLVLEKDELCQSDIQYPSNKYPQSSALGKRALKAVICCASVEENWKYVLSKGSKNECHSERKEEAQRCKRCKIGGKLKN